MTKSLSILLTLCLGFFLADAVVSLVDDTLILLFGVHFLTSIRGLVSFFTVIMAILIYLLMGITPMIPKRFFLPITLFGPVVLLGTIPLFIYHYHRLPQISWLLSFCQLLFGLGLVAWLQGGFKFRWPLVAQGQLGSKVFGWRNLFGFILVNVFVVLPAVLIYSGWCASLAVDHFSGGFLALRADRLTVKARQYIRHDGKTIHLIPMMHIGESNFYQQILKSIPTNSSILIEGVTDEKNLLKHKISYKRAATSVGLSEQQEEFLPAHGRLRHADVDVERFSKTSIAFLNLAMRIHAEGLTVEVFDELINKSKDPRLMEQLWEDLLIRRNEHLLKEIQEELLQSETIVVPWGAAHMRGIAEEIQKSGFQQTKAQEYTILHYRTIWEARRSRRK